MNFFSSIINFIQILFNFIENQISSLLIFFDLLKSVVTIPSALSFALFPILTTSVAVVIVTGVICKIFGR